MNMNMKYISKWNLNNVTNMYCVVGRSNFNIDTSKWNLSNVPSMFRNSPFILDTSKWNLSNVTNMFSMFCDSKSNLDISNWNINKAR